MERISQFLENQDFINWIFNPSPGLNLHWSKFQENYPDEKVNLLLARKVLQKFKTIDKQLSEHDKIILFSKILADIEGKQYARHKMRNLMVFMRYAAVAILFFAIGALLFYQRNFVDPKLFAQNIGENNLLNQTTLVRPGGETIELAENKSVFKYLADENKLVINDSIRLNKITGEKGNNLNRLSVPFGKTSTVILPDGTKVFLNAGSHLVFPEMFSNKKREVFLSGEAYFEVKKDSRHPFIVATTDINVEVKGTKFNLSAYSSDPFFETVLTEGKVRVRPNRAGIFSQVTDLIPNQLASYDRSLEDTKVKKVDVENYILWKDRMLKFESSELASVTRKLERYYNVRVNFTEQKYKHLKISGKFELSNDCDSVFEILASTASIKNCKKREKRI